MSGSAAVVVVCSTDPPEQQHVATLITPRHGDSTEQRNEGDEIAVRRRTGAAERSRESRQALDTTPAKDRCAREAST